MKTFRSIIIYGGNGENLLDPDKLHAYAHDKNRADCKILYYGLAVRGKCWDGSDASKRLIAIVESKGQDWLDIRRMAKDNGWNRIVDAINEQHEKGIFNKDCDSVWTSHRGWKSRKVKTLGEKYGVSCLYEFNESKKEPETKIFTYGDKRKTVKAFNTELCGEVTAKFKDLSGNGIPQEFSIQDGSINVKMAKDGKVRLCFAVHMKADKKDFADVKLQMKINELRKEVSTKYGVDIDIVDIRSTIEYV